MNGGGADEEKDDRQGRDQARRFAFDPRFCFAGATSRAGWVCAFRED